MPLAWLVYVPEIAGSIHWAGIVTSAGIVFVGLGAIYAGRAVEETKKARQTQTLVSIGQRWDEEYLLKARRLARAKPDSGDLWVEVQRLNQDNALDFFTLLREPNYFEELAILLKHDAVTFEAVSDMYRSTIIETYNHWKPSIEGFQAQRPRLFKEFEDLAQKMRENPPPS